MNKLPFSFSPPFILIIFWIQAGAATFQSRLISVLNGREQPVLPTSSNLQKIFGVQLSYHHLHAALPSFWKLPVSVSCPSQLISMQGPLFPPLQNCLDSLLGGAASKGRGSKVGMAVLTPQAASGLCKAEPYKTPPLGKQNKLASGSSSLGLGFRSHAHFLGLVC